MSRRETEGPRDMSMPTDFPVALAAGTVSAVIQARYIRLEKPDRTSGRVVKIGAAAGAWYALGTAYAFYHYPAWMYGYGADPAVTPPWLMFVFFLIAMALTGYCSAMLNQALIEAGKLKLAVAVAVAAVATCLIAVGLFYQALTHPATFAEWCAGTAAAADDPRNAHFQGMYASIGAIDGIAGSLLIAYLVRDALRLGKRPR